MPKRGEYAEVALAPIWVNRPMGLSLAEVARRMGVSSSRVIHLHRQIGCRYETAVRLCRALDLDPRECGL